MEEPLGKLVGLVRYGSANQAQGQVQWLWASAVKTRHSHPPHPQPFKGTCRKARASSFHCKVLFNSLDHSREGSDLPQQCWEAPPLISHTHRTPPNL